LLTPHFRSLDVMDPKEMSLLDEIERYRGSMLGLATGDAVGTAVEFRAPGTFTELSDMVGGGPFRLKPGQWTDDTSMALCLCESLVEQLMSDGGAKGTSVVRDAASTSATLSGRHCSALNAQASPTVVPMIPTRRVTAPSCGWHQSPYSLPLDRWRPLIGRVTAHVPPTERRHALMPVGTWEHCWWEPFRVPASVNSYLNDTAPSLAAGRDVR
jgi:hypothetical protein